MEERMLRLKQIIGDKKDGIPPMIPVSRSTIWQWVKDGKFPAPVKLGQATTCWKMSSVQQFIESGV
jgi:prophage regulatory protein